MPPPSRPKTCESCGNDFMPNSGAQKYCDGCREKPRHTRRKNTPTPKPRPRKAHEVPAHIAATIGERLREIDRQSYERFRGDD